MVYPPYLQRKFILNPPYTLLLDLDETLVHFVNRTGNEPNFGCMPAEIEEMQKKDFFYMIRPFCNKFLTELSDYYEIIIFTAATQNYADWIVNGIDP